MPIYFPSSLLNWLDLTQSLCSDRIGASKLCCPVCWDLLSLLKAKYFGNDKEDEQGLIVCGCHPMLYEVELPRGLPLDILQDMVTRYEQKLYDQLFSLASKLRHEKMHNHTHSMQSDRSVNSTVSGSLDGHVFKDDIAEGIRLKVFLEAQLES